MCRHLLIFLPLIVAVLELLSPIFRQRSSLLCTAIIALVLVVVPKRCKISDWRQVVRSASISVLGAFGTFFLANKFNLGPLVASAVIGLLGAIILVEEQQLVLYLGAFVGMTSTLRFPTWGLVIIAGLLAGMLWEVLSETWNGVGGRIGTVAATAVLIVVLVLGGGL